MADEYVKSLTATDFESETNTGIAIVDFWATWCGPCRRLGPIFDEAAAELAGKVSFFRVNVDEEQTLAVKFGIMSIPAMLIFRDGVLVNTMVGLRTKTQILEALAAV